MRVVLDSNVIVAAFAVRGLCHDVFEFCLQECTVILSLEILSEVAKALSQNLKLPPAKVSSLITFLKNEAAIVVPTITPEMVCRDPDDNAIIGTSVAGDAQVIVTGDEDLLILKKFKDVFILSPRHFWNYLTHEKQ
jgi:putative PIN family toxin of toxin-antitoxin system